MAKLNREYIEILSSDNKASDNFWKLQKRLKKDIRRTGVIADMRRSKLIENILDLLNDGAITLDDLEDFSYKLKETVHFLQTGERNFE